MKQRVPKGKYWYIATDYNGGISVYEAEDVNMIGDRNRWQLQNYFLTKKEAESMARKLRAVLKGADVIEMPSEEEIREYIDNYTRYPVTSRKAIDWLKSKIVK